MSGFAPKLQIGGMFNRSAYGGPMRVVWIGAFLAVVAFGIWFVLTSGSVKPRETHITQMANVDPLPGGTHSNQQQDKLALQADQEQADAATKRGQSFTPQINASQSTHLSPQADTGGKAATPSQIHPIVAAQTHVAEPLIYHPVVAAQPLAQAPPDPQEQAAYSKEINRLLRGWDGRSPVTVVSLKDNPSTGSSGGRGGQGGSASGDDAVRQASLSSGPQGRGGEASAGDLGSVIMPAGRGVFAHTVVAVSSDSGGPIILQADTGPLAGDRMIGTFAKAGSNGGSAADRLIVRVNSIEHRGESLNADGIVIAPDTMETTVASSVDEHYLSRFLLPAAAAFVQGLGQALATTSNTFGQLSPLGGTSYVTRLNLPQQLGVGAGAAAAQIGTTLNQQAPRGPTIHLAANADVGVMFLAPVRENVRR